MKLILASGSPWRKELLSWLDIPFEIIESGVVEAIYPDEEPSEVVARLAMAKAEAVAKKLDEQKIFGDDGETELVIAADTLIAYCDRPGDAKTKDHYQIFGKPADRKDARQIIKTLSNRTHEVWTGVCLWCTASGDKRVEVEKTLVTFRQMGEKEIDKYLQSNDWNGKAGGYQIQGEIKPYVLDVQGSYTNVIGLPLKVVQECLEETGVPVEVDLPQVIRAMTRYES